MSFRLLIVDDIEENIKALAESLADTGVEFVLASSAEDALKQLAYDSDIGLALIDVNMPIMDGFELASLMRGVEKTKDIPIIFVTARPYSYDFEFKGYDLGAIDFIFKPVNIKILKSKIDVFKKLREKRIKLDEKISELEIAKQALEESNQKAIEADHTKSIFLANMSHEIRTPITALIGFAELLYPLTSHNEYAREYTEIIIKNGKHLIDLVNEILDLSKVEAGQLNLEPSTVSLPHLLNDIVIMLDPLIQRNQVQLFIDLPKDKNFIFKADMMRLKQVITNITGNAIKFSPKGSVTIKLDRITKNTKENIQISIIDTGIGIDSSQINKLFRPFSQIVRSITLPVAGTGLGLYLSKKLVNLMGGDLYLEKTELGVGSTFVIEIPYVESAEKKYTDLTKKSSHNRFDQNSLNEVKVLLADDSPDNQVLIQTVLSKYGAQVSTVENGAEAVTYALDHELDIILMDYKMPKMDGLEAIKELKSKAYQKPIILLTANAMKGEKEIALKIGASGYVSKPIDWQDLIKQMKELIPKELH